VAVVAPALLSLEESRRSVSTTPEHDWTTMTTTRGNVDQPHATSDVVMVIVGEMVPVPEPAAMPPTNGDSVADPRCELPLNLVRRRMWWRRDRIVVTAERAR
jgi:hypothetical protein